MHTCIDLGSNSFHLLIGEWEDGRIEIVERLSEKVQLGENVNSTGRISPDAFERGLSCLHRFKLLMKQYPVQRYWALGTNTFRVAENTDEFIQAAKVKGIDISVISGMQEAVLVYAGVMSSLPVTDTHRLVIDIGGGSTELIIGKKHERLLTESLTFGSVSWSDR
ncbi:MAG: exopolyphosphatase, partial [Gammaproteobacteria bacterium]|nr:exopolyphosphatase [Gammaproteobacteria bacterium]